MTGCSLNRNNLRMTMTGYVRTSNSTGWTIVVIIVAQAEGSWKPLHKGGNMKIQEIAAIINKYEAKTTAKFGVYFKDLKTGENCGAGENEAYPSASVFKVFVLAQLMKMVGEGKCALTDRIPMRESDKSIGSGLIRKLDAGLNLTLKDYATLMMIISDNTAADFLWRFTGRDNIVNEVIEPLGLTKTKADLPCAELCAICYGIPADTNYKDFHNLAAKNVNKLRMTEPYLCTMEKDDATSPLDVAKVLELMYKGQWVDPQCSAQAMDIMKICETNSRIPRLLPEDTVVAHKTGTMDRVANDAGVVYTPAGDYILAMFYNGNTASQDEYDNNPDGDFGSDLMANLSKEIFDSYTK